MADQDARLARFKALAERHGADQPHTTTAEDIAPYLASDEPLPEWVAVTKHSEYVYLYPKETLADAQAQAARFIVEDIHEEVPIEVVSLDTGQRYVATDVHVLWQLHPCSAGSCNNCLGSEAA